jgi:hypothetical protein
MKQNESEWVMRLKVEKNSLVALAPFRRTFGVDAFVSYGYRAEGHPAKKLISLHKNALACLLLALIAVRVHAQSGQPEAISPPAPEVRVEFFGPERGYTVGSQSVTLLCVVRNVGAAPLPENALRLRCLAMAGLEYTTGDTRPTLPALAQNQAAAFRWRLSPTNGQGPMVAAALLENVTMAGGPAADGGPNTTLFVAIPAASRASLTVIPRLSGLSRAGSMTLPPGAAPRAVATEDDAWLVNDRVQVRVIAGERRFPVLLLAVKEGAGWKTVATSVPCAEVMAGEDGQLPWWETFRWRESRPRNEKTGATLTLVGDIGKRWRAELILESKPGTAAIDGRLRLIPLRTLRFYGVRLPRLLPVGDDTNSSLKADGSPLSVVQNEPILPEGARVGAARSNGVTFGIAWPATPPLADWKWNRLPLSDTNLLSVLGAEWDGPDSGGIIQPGATVDFTFRLFAFGPSDSLKDALRFMPPQ